MTDLPPYVPPAILTLGFWATVHGMADKVVSVPAAPPTPSVPHGAEPPHEGPEAPAPAAGPAPSGPVTSWAGVARAVRVSEDTLTRRRKAWGITIPKPYFPSAEEAREWYRLSGEVGARAVPATPPARRARVTRRPSRQGVTGTTLDDLQRGRKKVR